MVRQYDFAHMLHDIIKKVVVIEPKVTCALFW